MRSRRISSTSTSMNKTSPNTREKSMPRIMSWPRWNSFIPMPTKSIRHRPNTMTSCVNSRYLRRIGRLCRTCPLLDSSSICIAPLIRNEFLCLRRQLTLGSFGRNAMEVQKRLYSIFGLNLYRLVSRYPWLLNPDVFRPVDESLYVDAGFGAVHKIATFLASLHIGADSHQRQPASFLLIADVGANHFHSDNPSFVVLAEVVKVSDPLFAWNLSRLHVLPPPRID